MADLMRAAVLDEFGSSPAIRRIERPTAGPGELLVRVLASGVNPLDVKIRAGAAGHARTALPAVLGVDLAGRVEAVGDGVSGFDVGDEVYGLTGGVGAIQGSLAQYSAVDARLVARAPRTWTARQAAAVPLSAITAWEALVDRAAAGPGDTVLVHGGAGGIGHIAIQLAVERGCVVYATGSAADADRIEGLGATAIDYVTEAPQQYVAKHTGGDGFDIVLDTVGGPVLDASFGSVRTYTGRVVSILGWGTHSLAPLSFRGASYSGVFTLLPLLTGIGREHHGEILAAVTELAERGAITPLVDGRAFTLDTVDAAHDLVATGQAVGKVVVTVD